MFEILGQCTQQLGDLQSKLGSGCTTQHCFSTEWLHSSSGGSTTSRSARLLTKLHACRNLSTALNDWGISRATTGQAVPPSTPAVKGGSAAVVVAPLYNDKCKLAHEAAVLASQAVEGTRQALTSYMRQGGSSQQALPDLADLLPAEVRPAGNSFWWALCQGFRCVA